jgi:hypothetical protein
MFTATITCIKQADVQWYSKSLGTDTDNNKINDWIRSQPGFISISVNFPNENTLVSTTVFDSSENYHNMIFEAHSSHPEFKSRHEYNMAHDFIYNHEYEGE